MSQRFLLIVVFLLFASASCSDKPRKPENLIDEDKYTDLLIELQLIRSYGENAKTDSATIDSLTSHVFQKYGISADIFWKNHQYYQQFPKQQKVRAENAIERLKMDKVENTDEPRDTLSVNY